MVSITCLNFLILDPNPPKKIKRRWNQNDPPSKDPNWSENTIRARYGLPPIDAWNIGVEYEWDGTSLS